MRMRQDLNTEACLHVLVDRYKEKLYYHIHRIVLDHQDTDDVMQNTFIRFWEKYRDFREESALYTWLYRVATNEALSLLRKRKPHADVETLDSIDLMHHTVSLDLNGDDISKALETAIQSLPDKQRIVFNLRYYEEMPYQEMSEVLETSEGALKASYHIAVKKIEKVLGKQTF